MDVSFIEKAYKELFGESGTYKFSIRYSKAFVSYNANVKYTKNLMVFSLSHLWIDVSEEIKIGLIQSLFVKIFKLKDKKTISMDLYDLFLKNAHIGVGKRSFDPYLKSIFDKLNDMYFNGMLDECNLKWGQKSFRKLGSYTYSNDTISISTVLKKDEMLLEFVLYHEMIHKRLKFKKSGSKTFHHTKEFKEMEKRFYDNDAEKKLTNFLRKERLKNMFFG